MEQKRDTALTVDWENGQRRCIEWCRDLQT